MLEIRDLTVEVSGKIVLKNVNLKIPDGEVHVLFGPNGSGKTTLINTILGLSGYEVVSGKIFFDGRDITNLPIDERVRLGIAVAFQRPPEVTGVKLGKILELIEPSDEEKILGLLSNLRFSQSFLNRDLNVGFSGGEMKKSEILQVMAQNPKLAMFDEPDSGVDIENLELIGKALKEFLKGRSGLIVTHLGYILRYIEVDRGYVLYNGRIACYGDPLVILKQIEREGYAKCAGCLNVRRELRRP